MVFWLIGANAPIMKIHFKKIKKFGQKNPGMHLNILCPSTKVGIIGIVLCLTEKLG
jgi:hypothetical protein